MPPSTLTLTTPCTVTQLIEFVQHVVMPNYEGLEAQNAGDVTASANLISVA